uniref:Uncharacterized protein n=1 Tax=viral metagenome TaxID=1070528 RepID=A0A6C0E8N0_9ZZZZ
MYCLTNLLKPDSTNNSDVKIINYDNETSIETFKNVINLLSYNRNGYDKIYISFGSKLTDTFIKFDSPEKKRNKKFLSNSTEQMMPVFIKTSESDTRILCVVIDNFENEHNINKNMVLLESEQKPNIDIVIYDKFCSQPFLSELIKYFVKLFILFDLNQKNVMICNYVNYNNKTTNEIDLYSQKMIPETIQKVLDNPEFEKYTYCFYQWFGYKFYFYNFIYNYKIIELLASVNNNWLSDFEIFVKQLIYDHDETVFINNDSTKKQKIMLTDPKMLLVMDNVYDITSDCSYKYEIATSLRKYFYEHGQLELSYD